MGDCYLIIEMLFTNIRNEFTYEILDIANILGKEIEDFQIKHYQSDFANFIKSNDKHTFSEYSNLDSQRYSSMICRLGIKPKQYKLKYNMSDYGLFYIITDNGNEKSFLYIKLIFNKNTQDIYRIKILIKEKLRDFYKDFYWLWDDQARDFNIKCYDKIFDLENQMRRLIVASFIKLFGVEWWEQKAPKELKELAKGYEVSTKRIGGKTWSKVKDYLYNINIDDLVELISKERAELELSNEALGKRLRECQTDQEVIQLRNKITKYSLWDNYFSKIFEDKIFTDRWFLFTGYRNVIAHNKWMDYNEFIKFNSLYADIKKDLCKAYINLPKIHISDKEQQQLNVLLESETSDIREISEKTSRAASFISIIDSWFEEIIMQKIYFFCDSNDYLLNTETVAVDEECVLYGKIYGNEAIVDIFKVIQVDDDNEDFGFYFVLNGENIDFYYSFPVQIIFTYNHNSTIYSVSIVDEDLLAIDFANALESLDAKIIQGGNIPRVNDYYIENEENEEEDEYYYSYPSELIEEDHYEIFDSMSEEEYDGIIENFIIE